MAIVKASYTRKGRVAKAAVRYIENRPGKDGVRVIRTLFKADGKVERGDVYDMIDRADKTSYFFRLVISPDPQREDSDKSLSLREITERTMQTPFKLERMDWRQHPMLQKRRTAPVPELPALAPLADLSVLKGVNPSVYKDPDR